MYYFFRVKLSKHVHIIFFSIHVHTIFTLDLILTKLTYKFKFIQNCICKYVYPIKRIYHYYWCIILGFFNLSLLHPTFSKSVNFLFIEKAHAVRLNYLNCFFFFFLCFNIRNGRFFFFFKEKWWERCNIRTFQEVTNLGTIFAQARLTAKFWWDPVH